MRLIDLWRTLHLNITMIVDTGIITKVFESEKVTADELWFGDLWRRYVVDIEIVDSKTLRIQVRSSPEGYEDRKDR